MFVALDGFHVRISRAILPTDTFISIPKRFADILSQSLPSGSYTYLTLSDGISYEIIRVDGGDKYDCSAGYSEVPVVRDATNKLARFNFPIGRTLLRYEITTPVIQELIKEQLITGK